MSRADDPDADRSDDAVDGADGAQADRADTGIERAGLDGVPLDQLPVDLQPTLPPVRGGVTPMPPSMPPSVPPSIPPLRTTTPQDVVASATPDRWETGRFGVSALDEVVVPDGAPFEPLRSEPPPRLTETRWVRWMLFVSMVVALVVTTAHLNVGEGVGSTLPIVALHGIAVGLLAFWSGRTMHNSAAVEPPTRYQRRPRATTAVLSVVFGASLPAGLAAAVAAWADGADDAGDLRVAAWVGVAAVSSIAVSTPVRLHAVQAARIGAPTRPIIRCVLVPLGTMAVGVLVLALVRRDALFGGDLTGVDRWCRSVVWYGLPMASATLTVWRAVTVFDEVIELRWQRWRSEWDRTLDTMAALPPPGPEGSPDLDVDDPRRSG